MRNWVFSITLIGSLSFSMSTLAAESYSDFVSKVYACMEQIPVEKAGPDEFSYEVNRGSCENPRHMRVARDILKSGKRGNHCSGTATMLRAQYRRINRTAVTPPFSPMGTKADTYGTSRSGRRGFEHYPIDENMSRTNMRSALQSLRGGDMLYYDHINCTDQYNFSGHIMSVAEVIRENGVVVAVKVIEGHQGRSYPTYRTLNIDSIITNAKFDASDPYSSSGIPDISCCEFRGVTRWNAELENEDSVDGSESSSQAARGEPFSAVSGLLAGQSLQSAGQ